MKTYPIYECLFLGSADCMCGTTVRLAARSKRHALQKFRRIQNSRTNIIGPMGRRVPGEQRTVCDQDVADLVKDIRATRIDYHEHRRTR